MDEQEEFLHRLAMTYPTGECVEWPWGKSGRGYGHRKHRRVTHIILDMAGFQRPSPDHQALHSCDNPPCVAPWHLRWGTNAENVQERVERGRNLHGEEHGRAKLTETDVRTIREAWAAGYSLATLGRRYGVNAQQISRIVRREQWVHVL